MHAKLLQLCPTLCDPWIIAHQDPLSMGFSKQEYWSGLPCSPPGDLPDPGVEPMSLTFLHWQVGSLPLAPLGKPKLRCGQYHFSSWLINYMPIQ